MGVSYSARALIGCRFTEVDLFEIRRVKRFEHNYPAEMNYCPKSGQPLWMDRKVFKLSPSLEDLSCVEPAILSEGLYCFHDGRSSWGDQKLSHDHHFLIGICAIEEDDDRRRYIDSFCALNDSIVQTARQSCQKVLEPYNLWRPKQFGLHVMQYVSC